MTIIQYKGFFLEIKNCQFFIKHGPPIGFTTKQLAEQWIDQLDASTKRGMKIHSIQSVALHKPLQDKDKHNNPFTLGEINPLINKIAGYFDGNSRQVD